MPGLAGHHIHKGGHPTPPNLATPLLLLLLYYIGDAASAGGVGSTQLLHHIPKHPKTGSLGYSRLTVYVRIQLLLPSRYAIQPYLMLRLC